MNTLDVRNLCKQLDSFTLKNISFSIQKGTVMGLIGQNGAGKSTTIKSILNILHIDSGEIDVFGKPYLEEEVVWKQEIGVVFDDLLFPKTMTAQKVERFLSNVYRNWDSAYFFQLLEQFQLPLHKKIAKLSRGMKMKLSIATALAHHPKLLILDEPTSGLDPIIRDEILDLLLAFMENEENSILLSSHITSDLEKIADVITCIHNGEILFSHTKDTLLFEYGIWRGSKEQAKDLPEQAIIARRTHSFGTEILLHRQHVNPIFELAQPSIEDVMLFTIRGESR